MVTTFLILTYTDPVDNLRYFNKLLTAGLTCNSNHLGCYGATCALAPNNGATDNTTPVLGLFGAGFASIITGEHVFNY